MFTIRIEKAETTCPDNITLTSGMVKAVKVAFDFSEEWEGFNKVAVFSNGTTTLDVSLDENDKAYVPHEVLEIPGKEVSVGVYGSKGEGEDYVAIPTEKCSLGKVVEGVDPTGEEPSEPTPSVWDEINLKVENLYRDVDLTKCVEITDGEGDVTENTLCPKMYTTAEAMIKVIGYVELEVTGQGGAEYFKLVINGTQYDVSFHGANSVFQYKGVVTEPIVVVLDNSAKATFTRFVTTADYELQNKVGDINTALEAIIAEQEAIIAMQNSLIGGDA